MCRSASSCPGGIDSSAIAALMANMIGRPLQTFSVAFKARAFSELSYARQVSQAIGAEANEIVIDDRDFFGALPRLIWHEDEPIAHPSSVPLYFVSKLAREKVTVVLTGEGSDELLAGYGKYPRSLLNWRAGSIYAKTVPQAAAAPACGLDRAHAGTFRALRAAVLRRSGSRARPHVLRHLRRHRSARVSGACCRRASRCSSTRSGRTARRWRTSTPRTTARACSTACSMRT